MKADLQDFFGKDEPADQADVAEQQVTEEQADQSVTAGDETDLIS